MRIYRDYQVEADRAVLREFAAGTRSTLVVLPTGCGKTLLFGKIATDWPADKGRVLVIAHRVELLDQAADKIAVVLGYRPPIEQGERGVDPDGILDVGNVIVGSVQTLRGSRRLDKFLRDPVGLIIIDEGHHATAASYQKIVDTVRVRWPDCKVLLVTATPNRADGTALQLVADTVAYEMNILDAIELGWLVPIKQKFIHIEGVDFSMVNMGKNELGEKDFDRNELEAILTQDKPLQAIAKPVLDATPYGEQCLVFTSGVKHAHMLAEVLNAAKDGSAKAVDGKTDKEERALIVQDFKSGKVQYLCNFGVFTEGFDHDAVSHVIMARPTKSLGLYLQMLGRGTRPLNGTVDGQADSTPEKRRAAIAGSGKPLMTVMDFVGNTRHKPVSSIDALAGNMDPEIKKLAEDAILENGGDVLEQIKKARADFALMKEVKEMRKTREQAAREAAAKHADEIRRQRLRRQYRADVTYTAHDVDSFGAAPIEPSRGDPEGRSGGDKATPKQVGYLVYLGVEREVAANYSKRQAGAVIDSLKRKREGAA